MPFESERQRRFMFAKHPRIAKRWAHEAPDKDSGLPAYKHGKSTSPELSSLKSRKVKPPSKRKTASSGKHLTRYEHNGVGAYEAVRRAAPGKHAQLQDSDKYKWLPRPDKDTAKGSRSFFTDKGARKYEKRVLPEHKKILGPVRKRRPVVKKTDIAYEDGLQVLKKTAGAHFGRVVVPGILGAAAGATTAAEGERLKNALVWGGAGAAGGAASHLEGKQVLQKLLKKLKGLRKMGSANLPVEKTGAMLGPCLISALKDLKKNPHRQLMMGPSGTNFKQDTSHFWTEDKGKVHDYSNAVPKTYVYKGRPVNANSVRAELIENGKSKRMARYGLLKKAAVRTKYELFDHQKVAIKQLIDNDGVIVLAHGTGTGKTFTAIAGFEVLKQQGKARRALVVVPTPLRDNFVNSGIKKFTNSTVQTIGNKQESAKMPGYRYVTEANSSTDYVVVGYEMFRKNPEMLMQQTGADTLIFDEYHKARDPGSLTFKAAMRARQQARNFIGATASIVNNNPNEVAPLVAIAKSGKYYSRTQFDKIYKQQTGVRRGFFGGKQKTYKLKNLGKLRGEIGPLVSYLDTNDLRAEDMPKKKLQEVNVQMSDRQKELYNYAFHKLDRRTAARIRQNLPPESPKEAMTIFTTILMARKASNSIAALDDNVTLAESAEQTPKVKRMLDEAVEHLQTTPDGKVVMFSNLIKGGVDVLDAGLTSRGIKHGLFIGKGRDLGGGKVTSESRDKAVRDYKAGKTKVIVLSGAGAEGLDLRNSTMFQALDGHFNPERILQAEARARRLKGLAHREPGKREVIVRRYRSVLPEPGFFAKMFGGDKKEFTTDEWIYNTAQRKHALNRMLRHAVKSVSLAKVKGKPPEIDVPRPKAPKVTAPVAPTVAQLRTPTAPRKPLGGSTGAPRWGSSAPAVKVPRQHKYLRKWRNPRTGDMEYEYPKEVRQKSWNSLPK